MFNKIYDWLKNFIRNNLKGLIILIGIIFLCFYKVPYVISLRSYNVYPPSY